MSSDPIPVDGDEFPVSKSQTLIFAAGSALGAVFCAIMAVVGLVSLFNGNSIRLFWIVVFLVAPVMFGIGSFQLMKSIWVRRKLIVGDDFVQITERHDGEERVVVQIPYECLDDIRCTRVDFGNRIDFEFDDLRHPDTVLPPGNIEHTYINSGYHHALSDVFSEDSCRLVRLMQKRWKKWRRTHEEDS